jgi:hypothetical protein
MPVIPALKRLRQEDEDFQASLGYTNLKKKKKFPEISFSAFFKGHHQLQSRIFKY